MYASDARCANPALSSPVLSSLVGLLVLLCIQSPANADVVDFFDTVAGDWSGEFAWDDFGLTGTPYAGPHNPDQYSAGAGAATLNVSPGGIITGTNNLYSFNSVPDYSTNLTSLETTEDYTSVVVQFAASGNYAADRFTLDGATPDEFLNFGVRTSAGGFPYNFYWAEWQGIAASSDLVIELSGTGMHQSLAGAKATYFNTSSNSFDIRSVPEPGSAAIILSLLTAVGLRRHRG